MTDDVTLPRDKAQAVFDVAVHSMDFGSGFLDHEEVDALRAFAALIGIDPMNATPGGFRTQYAHEYRPAMRPQWGDRMPNGRVERLPDREVCEWCEGDVGSAVHRGEAQP